MQNMDSLKNTALFKMMYGRVNAVKNAPAVPVKDLYAYPANKMALALHPHAQFLKVKEIIAHSDDFKSFIFEPDAAKGTKSLAWFSAGQYLVLAVNVGGKIYSRL